MYIPSFKQLSQCVQLDREKKTIQVPDEILGRFLGSPRLIEAINLGPRCLITVPLSEFAKVIERAIGTDYVDEDWYRRQYPDIDKAIVSKTFGDGRSHFCLHGYLEGRAPRLFHVNEEWYLEKNQDVSAAVRKKTVSSASAHYQASGYSEGRVPAPDAVAGEVSGWNDLIARLSRDAEQEDEAGDAKLRFGRPIAKRAQG